MPTPPIGLKAMAPRAAWKDSARKARAIPSLQLSHGRNGLPHVAVGGGGRLLRTASVLTRAQVGRIPVRPVMLVVRTFVVAVPGLRLAEELCKGDVHVSRSRRLPLAARQPRLDLLQQPAVPVRILERGERVVGTTLGVAPDDAGVLHGVVE